MHIYSLTYCIILYVVIVCILNLEYALHYQAGNKPSTVMKHLLHTIREWEKDGFNVFATVYETQVMKQAAASDARHAEGKPLR